MKSPYRLLSMIWSIFQTDSGPNECGNTCWHSLLRNFRQKAWTTGVAPGRIRHVSWMCSAGRVVKDYLTDQMFRVRDTEKSKMALTLVLSDGLATEMGKAMWVGMGFIGRAQNSVLDMLGLRWMVRYSISGEKCLLSTYYVTDIT